MECLFIATFLCPVIQTYRLCGNASSYLQRSHGVGRLGGDTLHTNSGVRSCCKTCGKPRIQGHRGRRSVRTTYPLHDRSSTRTKRPGNGSRHSQSPTIAREGRLRHGNLRTVHRFGRRTANRCGTARMRLIGARLVGRNWSNHDER